MVWCHSYRLRYLANIKPCSPLQIPPGLVELVNLAPTEVHRKLLLTHGLEAYIGPWLLLPCSALEGALGIGTFAFLIPDPFLEMNNGEMNKKLE